MTKRISLVAMSIFYIAPGINHFLHPDTYTKIVPYYLPNPPFINLFSGAIEIVLGTLLLFSKTRKLASYGIILLLIAFIPAHIIMIQKGFCLSNGFCFPAWVMWIRLFPLQFLLIIWAWSVRK